MPIIGGTDSDGDGNLDPVLGGIGDGQPFSNTLPKWYGPRGECGACGCWYCTDPVALQVGDGELAYGQESDCFPLDGTYAWGLNSLTPIFFGQGANTSGQPNTPGDVSDWDPAIQPYTGWYGNFFPSGDWQVPFVANKCWIRYQRPLTKRWELTNPNPLTMWAPCTMNVLDYEEIGKPFNCLALCSSYVNRRPGATYGTYWYLFLLSSRILAFHGNWGDGNNYTLNGYPRFGKPWIEVYLELYFGMVIMPEIYSGGSGCQSFGGTRPNILSGILIRYEYIKKNLDCREVADPIPCVARRGYITNEVPGGGTTQRPQAFYYDRVNYRIRYGSEQDDANSHPSPWINLPDPPTVRLVF